MTVLTLNLKGIYFRQIRYGVKPFEFRLITPHWRRRLEGREYERVMFCLGYPAHNDHHRQIVRLYAGYEIQTIQHEHFGPEPVEVFAIRVSPK